MCNLDADYLNQTQATLNELREVRAVLQNLDYALEVISCDIPWTIEASVLDILNRMRKGEDLSLQVDEVVQNQLNRRRDK